jgi:hypothetical protein
MNSKLLREKAGFRLCYNGRLAEESSWRRSSNECRGIGTMGLQQMLTLKIIQTRFHVLERWNEINSEERGVNPVEQTY